MHSTLIKKTGVILLLLSFIGQTGKSLPVSSFTINGKISTLTSSAKVILTLREDNQWTEYPAEVKSGKFTISGKVNEPAFAFLVLKYGNELDKSPRLSNVLRLFVDNSTIVINAKDSLINATIEGSPVQSDFTAYQNLISEWKKKNETSDLRIKMIVDFISQHPQSPVSIFAIQNLSLDESFTLDAADAKPLFELLSPQLKATATGKSLEKDIAIALSTAIGAPAPDFTQADTSNLPVSLNSFRGKYVLIDFWASWCKPCRAENPQLVKTFNQFKDKNFTVLSVSLDNNKNSWKKAILKDRLEWTHVSDLQFWKNEVAQLYGVKTVPQNFLIDPSGKIIGKGIKVAELEKTLSEVINR